MTARPIRIRPATPKDLPVIMEMFDALDELQAGWRVFPVRASLREEMRAKYEAALEAVEAILLVAEDAQTVVGMAEGTVHRPSSFSDELAVELSSVYVLPSHRGRGLGRRLTAGVAEFALDQGVHQVTLKAFVQNEEAVAVWYRLGFSARALQMTAPAGPLAGHLSGSDPTGSAPPD